MPQLPTDDVPHTALTDHRLLRKPAPLATVALDPRQLVFFSNTEQHLPEREKERSRGILLAQEAMRINNGPLASEAAELLNPLDILDLDQKWLEALGDDVESLFQLGAALIMLRDGDTARLCWQKALEVQPGHEDTINALMLLYQQDENWELTLSYADRLLKENPFDPRAHWTRTLALDQLGRTSEAIASAEGLLQLDPSAWFVRAWLVGTYRMQGDQAAAEAQRDILSRLPRPDGPPRGASEGNRSNQ
jgi:tetratricopeptide (TPR) repeat protein